VLVRVVITISDGDDVDAKIKRADDGGDHFKQWQ
jgi:hypothetical protein